MLRERFSPELSEFLNYLASHKEAEAGLPSLTDLSRELGISVAALREQLEVARALGLVEVKPRTGTRRLPFSFTHTVRQSLGYALALEDSHFQKFAELRNHIEAAYWNEAVRLLTDEDKNELKSLITRAQEKLRGTPVQVPHEEHRRLHLLIYRRLDNPFVTGILEAYWDAYEAVGLNMYAGGMDYLNEVWRYHSKMVESICNGKYETGRKALIEHVDLLAQRPS
ncbi:MAG TPA: FCD domain-containing protein [Anaerolineales bacterium]|jgi:DNA-binding FadR family transcriptional regulator|nr:FCD domain-containing protein [Anaerolineales bacterium]